MYPFYELQLTVVAIQCYCKPITLFYRFFKLRLQMATPTSCFFYTIYFFSILTVTLSCKLDVPKKVRVSLVASKNNRPELERVIAHYKATNDSLKLKAAYFLIENLGEHFFFRSDVLDNYNRVFDHIGTMDYWHKKLYMDSIKMVFGPLEDLNTSNDIDVITSQELIENIDMAFFVWKTYPWTKDLTFSQFCSYILPYRSSNEPLNRWRKNLNSKYKWILDSVNNLTKLEDVCTIVNNEMKGWFQYHLLGTNFPGGISINNIIKGKSGICTDMSNLAVYVMRSVGIPVTADYTPQWGNKGVGHSWNALITPNEKTIKFMGAESSPGEGSEYWTDEKPAKIFRRTFKIQNNSLLANELVVNVPPYLRSKLIIDVTKEYVPVSDVALELKSDSLSNYKNVFLCVFNNQSWNAIDWSKINGNKGSFKNLGREVVYMPMFYSSYNYHPAAMPFLITKEGNIQILKPDTKRKRTVYLYRKYPLFSNMIKYANDMIGGKFQGSKTSDFKDAIELFTISKTPNQYLNTINLKNAVKFRYVRYYPLQKSDQCNIAEVEFLNGHSRLKGNLIGTDTAYVEGSTTLAKNAFDEDWNSYFAKNHTGETWVGLDFGSPVKITSLKYLPRNDTNMILVGDNYELFYWDNAWISLGSQTGKNDHLVYNNAPENSLFLLRNLTRGKEERIFTIKDGQQIFW